MLSLFAAAQHGITNLDYSNPAGDKQASLSVHKKCFNTFNECAGHEDANIMNSSSSWRGRDSSTLTTLQLNTDNFLTSGATAGSITPEFQIGAATSEGNVRSDLENRGLSTVTECLKVGGGSGGLSTVTECLKVGGGSGGDTNKSKIKYTTKSNILLVAFCCAALLLFTRSATADKKVAEGARLQIQASQSRCHAAAHESFVSLSLSVSSSSSRVLPPQPQLLSLCGVIAGQPGLKLTSIVFSATAGTQSLRATRLGSSS